MLCLMSCDNERANLVSEFNHLYNEAVYKDYAEKLNAESKAFYEKITDKTYLNIDSLVSLGLEYNIPYFTSLYLASCGDHMIKSNEKEDFFLYLVANNISFFTLEEFYEILEEKSRVDKDGWVSIYRKEGGQNYVSWVRYTSENERWYYDLLYTLQIHEKEYKRIYDEFKKDYPDLTKEEYFETIFNMYNNQSCEVAKIKNKFNS